MFTVVIGDGLTNEFLSPEIQLQGSSLHVGRPEIDHLEPTAGIAGVVRRAVIELLSRLRLREQSSTDQVVGAVAEGSLQLARTQSDDLAGRLAA